MEHEVIKYLKKNKNFILNNLFEIFEKSNKNLSETDILKIKEIKFSEKNEFFISLFLYYFNFLSEEETKKLFLDLGNKNNTSNLSIIFSLNEEKQVIKYINKILLSSDFNKNIAKYLIMKIGSSLNKNQNIKLIQILDEHKKYSLINFYLKQTEIKENIENYIYKKYSFLSETKLSDILIYCPNYIQKINNKNKIMIFKIMLNGNRKNLVSFHKSYCNNNIINYFINNYKNNLLLDILKNIIIENNKNRNYVLPEINNYIDSNKWFLNFININKELKYLFDNLSEIIKEKINIEILLNNKDIDISSNKFKTINKL